MDLNFTTIDKHNAGFITKPDRSQLPPGAMKVGSQNIVITDGDRIGIRNGLNLFGATSAASTPVTSSWTHRRRESTNPEIQAEIVKSGERNDIFNWRNERQWNA